VGTGVQFLDLRAEDRDKIRHLVDRLSGALKPAQEDPRTSTRLRLNLPVTLSGSEPGGEGFEEQTTLLTLSKNGASVRTQRALGPGMRVFLRTSRGARFEATIIWAQDGEAGLQCRQLAAGLGFHFP
jgi:hypothetical protein